MDDYLSRPFPFNLPLVKERLDKKIEEDPDYEVFLPFYYRKLDSSVKTKNAIKVIALHYLFISNKGRVLSNHVVKEPRIITPYLRGSGYPGVSISISGKLHGIALHRALACVFVPVPGEILAKGLGVGSLHVNHLNGIKEDFDLDNLEWTTPADNVAHAHVNGLIVSGYNHSLVKPIKGKIVKGNFTSYEFIIFGNKDAKKHGFNRSLIYRVIKGDCKQHGNCHWTFASEEDVTNLPRGIPEDILADIKAA